MHLSIQHIIQFYTASELPCRTTKKNSKNSVYQAKFCGKHARKCAASLRKTCRLSMSARKLKDLIRSKGGKPAFPCNVSINEVAAHYTAPPGDTSRIPEGSTVKVDIGVQVDGYVTDTAFTAAFSAEGRSMAATAELALKTAIDNIHGDMALGKIGSLIETTIKNRGFKPISNLTGHSVGRYLIHAGTSIPNVAQVIARQSSNRRSLRHRTLRHPTRRHRHE